ncbi:hypothetical protein QUF74_00380 [Candidatus Halobeggiatoa sp. HSG11]|nr:hypothetical protein [Candidatus Halobeggiatoa sp. HSG11]
MIHNITCESYLERQIKFAAADKSVASYQLTYDGGDFSKPLPTLY